MDISLHEKIVQIGNKWQVQSEKGRNLGTYDTKPEAEERLRQVHYFKHKNEDLELDVADGGVPSLHSKKDDRYGHHNYKIEDPDLKRRLAEANPHLAKFLDDHYVWYLIAWAKGIEDGTSYQGFLNIFDDETRWKKVHGSYSDGFRPDPELVKDIVFNSIEEELDLDVTTSLEPGHVIRDGEYDYYIPSQQQASVFMSEYVKYAKKHFDTGDCEFLEDSYSWSVNDPDGYFDISLIQDGYMIYITVWDDYGISNEQGVPIDTFKELKWDEIIDVDSIPMLIDESLDLDVSDKVTSKVEEKPIHTSPELRVIGTRVVLPEDRKQLLFNLLSEIGDESVLEPYLNDKYDWIVYKYYDGKCMCRFIEVETGYAVTGFGMFGLSIPEDIYDAVVDNSIVKEDLDLEVAPYDDSWKAYHDTLDPYFSLTIYDAERLIMEKGQEASWFLAYYLDGSWLSGAYQDLSDELNGFMTFDEAFMKFKETEIGEDERLVVCYHQGATYDEDDELDFGEEDYPILAKGSEKTEAQLFEDLDLDIVTHDDSWKKYHAFSNNLFSSSISIYEAEELIKENGSDNIWYLAYFEADLRGYPYELPENVGSNVPLRQRMSFYEAFELFQKIDATKFNKGDRLELWYDGTEQDYVILDKKADLNEDLELDPIEADNILEPYLTPLTDKDIINKLEETFNVYILPNGKAGFVDTEMVDMGSVLEDEMFDYIEDDCICMWGSSDTFETNFNHLFVEFPKHRLTEAQLNFLVRNKAWLWESRIPEDSEEFTGTNNGEYATADWGYYGISVNDSVADGVDDYLEIHGYTKVEEELDLDVVDVAPYDSKYLIKRYDVDSAEAIIEHMDEPIWKLFTVDSWSWTGSVIKSFTADGTFQDMYNRFIDCKLEPGAGAALAFKNGNAYSVIMKKDSDNNPITEDLDLDVSDITPEKLSGGSRQYTRYRISLSTLYELRELKKRIYGDFYDLAGGDYLNACITRIEEDDEDMAGDIYLDVFDMGGIEYRVSFGEYCICTLCIVDPYPWESSMELKYAKAIEKELGLPELASALKTEPTPDFDLVFDDVTNVTEDLDLDVVHEPSQKLISNSPENNPISGCCRIGMDAKQKIIDYVASPEGGLPFDYRLSTAQNSLDLSRNSYSTVDVLNNVISETWVYFPEDLGVEPPNVIARFKGRIVILDNNAGGTWAFKPNETVLHMITDNSIDTKIAEDLDLDPVDASQLDERIILGIRNFLLDMGEYCVVIGNTIFEGNPAGIRNAEGHYEPCRDAAYKVHNGEVTFYFPEDMPNNPAEVAEWNRIESAAVIDHVDNPEDYLKNYMESTTMGYEQAMLNLGDTWGYSHEETENEFLSKI